MIMMITISCSVFANNAGLHFHNKICLGWGQLEMSSASLTTCFLRVCTWCLPVDRAEMRGCSMEQVCCCCSRHFSPAVCVKVPAKGAKRSSELASLQRKYPAISRAIPKYRRNSRPKTGYSSLYFASLPASLETLAVEIPGK